MTEKSSSTETLRAEQGSQPHFGDLRVGIMRVGEHEGRRKARLWINGPDTHLRTDLSEGESRRVAGHGTLTLDAVHLTSPRHGEVTLTFLADDA